MHGYQRRARLAGLTWPLPDGLDDDSLELLLFPAPTAASHSDRRPEPDWIYVEKELRRRSVTRLLLWEEYRAANPDGFGYTWFCTTYRARFIMLTSLCLYRSSCFWSGLPDGGAEDDAPMRHT